MIIVTAIASTVPKTPSFHKVPEKLGDDSPQAFSFLVAI
jgi:hypothetical protein